MRGIGPNDVLKLSSNTTALFVGPIDWSWGTDLEIAAKRKAVETLYDMRCNQVEFLMQEAGMLLERALGDVLKYDGLNLERFKVMLEFIEYDRTQNQQAIELADADYWSGLVNEEDLAAQARTHMSDNEAATTERYEFAIRSFNEAAADASRDGDAGDVSRQNASGSAASTKAAELQFAAQAAASKSDAASHLARKKSGERLGDRWHFGKVAPVSSL
jgi:hypothetical protein